jgi:hypothetical protein
MDSVPSDAGKSLQDLDGQDWGESSGNSYLERECHRLRRVPLRELSPEDLRLLLGQGIGQEYLLPLALAQLVTDPLVAGDYYPGDLLLATLAVPPYVWQRHPKWQMQAVALAQRALSLVNEGSPAVGNYVAALLQEQVGQFLQIAGGEPNPD